MGQKMGFKHESNLEVDTEGQKMGIKHESNLEQGHRGPKNVH